MYLQIEKMYFKLSIPVEGLHISIQWDHFILVIMIKHS